MNCLFQLNNYQIERVAVEPYELYDASLSEHTGNITTTINIAPHMEDKRKFRLILWIQINPIPMKEQSFYPYHITINGRAFFTFKDIPSHEEAEYVLSLNGASILYGFLRAQVAQITAQSVHGQFLLPTVNFVEMYQAQQKAKPSEAAKGTDKKIDEIKKRANAIRMHNERRARKKVRS
jgi:preprotein translocase subunit SecB